jgi:hypothetical protein
MESLKLYLQIVLIFKINIRILTIVEVVHYMVHHRNLDASYWVEARTTTINLKARSPHKEIGGHQKEL